MSPRKPLVFQFFEQDGSPRYRTEFFLDDPEVTDEMILSHVQRIFQDELGYQRGVAA